LDAVVIEKCLPRIETQLAKQSRARTGQMTAHTVEKPFAIAGEEGPHLVSEIVTGESEALFVKTIGNQNLVSRREAQTNLKSFEVIMETRERLRHHPTFGLADPREM
jgi:archaellum component FlaG (FlaF/FlaG flagellin family)